MTFRSITESRAVLWIRLPRFGGAFLDRTLPDWNAR